MAVTCRDIMNLECCREIRLLAGAEGLDREVSWPYVKSMDTISEWIHGGELVFVIGFREDVSEKGLLELLDEAVRCGIAGLVLLYGGEYIKCVPKSVRAYAEKRGLPLFRMPFMLKLIDITREISKYIIHDREVNQIQGFPEKDSVLELLLEQRPGEEVIARCRLKLQPLMEADKVLRTELVKTLKMYLEHGNELVSTAADMYIHRNTLVNRMKKIDALLGVNVNDPETRYEFGTVYRILEYYGAL